MDKKAFNVFEGWEALSRNPVIGTAKMFGQFVPGLGQAISGGDLLSALYHGRPAGALTSAFGVLPGGGALAKSLAKGGPAAQRTAKVLGGAKKIAPWISPAQAKTTGQIFGTMGTGMAASALDEALAMRRPAVRKQIREQQEMMREFEEWQRLRQQLRKAAGVEKEAIAPTLGEAGGTAWGYGKNIAPYLIPALMGLHAGERYQAGEGLPGVGRGAAEGALGGVGAIGGGVGGAMGGTLLANLLAPKLGMDPRMAAAGFGSLGALLGGVGGHKLGKRSVGAIEDVISPEEQAYGRRYKFASEFLKEAARGREQQIQAKKQRTAQARAMSQGIDPFRTSQADIMAAVRRGRGKAALPPLAVAPQAAEAAAGVSPMPQPPAPGAGATQLAAALGSKPVMPIPAPKTMLAPAGTEPMAEPLMSRLRTHPMMQWTKTPKGQAAMLGALALAGGGAYLMGRRRRKKEDEAVEKEDKRQVG